MVYIGIDPGKEGAIAAITEDRIIQEFHTLKFLEDGSFDMAWARTILGGFSFSPHRLFLERAIPMAMGSKSAFEYGRNFAQLEIAIQDSKLSYSMVEPSKWPKVVLEGIDKDLRPKVRSAVGIRRLFPNEIEKIPIKKKVRTMHEGVVDAILIAEWGRRQALISQ